MVSNWEDVELDDHNIEVVQQAQTIMDYMHNAWDK